MCSADVDEEALFREVKTISLRCQLPSGKEGPQRAPASAATQQAAEAPEAAAATPEAAAAAAAPEVAPAAATAAADTAAAGEAGVCDEVSVVVTLGPRVYAQDFGSLREGGAYMLELQPPGASEENSQQQQQQQQELQLLRQQVGDKWRRLSVEVDPLLHIEAQKAVLQMRGGAHTPQQYQPSIYQTACMQTRTVHTLHTSQFAAPGASTQLPLR